MLSNVSGFTIFELLFKIIKKWACGSLLLWNSIRYTYAAIGPKIYLLNKSFFNSSNFALNIRDTKSSLF